MPNLRYTARARPQSLQRRFSRVVNLGARFALANLDFDATFVLYGRKLPVASSQ